MPTPGGDHTNPFAGKSPHEVLRELLNGDPLEIGARCTEHQKREALLIAQQRLHLRAVARVAYAAPGWDAVTGFNALVIERVAFSARELLAEDRESARSGTPAAPIDDDRQAWVVQFLGLDPALFPRAAVRFHDLPRETREVFLRAVFGGEKLAQIALAMESKDDQTLGRLRTSLRAFGVDESRIPGWQEGSHDG